MARTNGPSNGGTDPNELPEIKPDEAPEPPAEISEEESNDYYYEESSSSEYYEDDDIDLDEMYN